MIKKLLWQLFPFLAFVVVVLLFTLAYMRWGQWKFLSAYNWRGIMSNASLIAVPAFGMTMIIIAGGIDLSAGTALTLCGTVLAVMLKVLPDSTNFAVWVSIALVLMVSTGVLCGLINGLLISMTNVVPFIVTLGTMTIFLGIGQILSNE